MQFSYEAQLFNKNENECAFHVTAILQAMWGMVSCSNADGSVSEHMSSPDFSDVLRPNM